MENKVIKIDVTASEDAYFMATHMPFDNLEVYHDGKIDSKSQKMSEEKVYRELIVNPDDQHRLIIVRGRNGTGKSHLIRWLKARFENDEENYKPDTERIVFIRRLGNTIKGAIAQLLDEEIILDEDIVNKLQDFISKTESQDEGTFKSTIFYAFVNKVQNDNSNTVYSVAECKDLAQFLNDKRIMSHLMREGGAISRCYDAIVKPSNTVFRGEAIFEKSDFDFTYKIMTEIRKKASIEAQVFADQIYKMEDEIEKLVKYLNGFTPQVIQSCADISSESAQQVFVELRRALKRQGKNLTIFIEDFTAFTGIDSELITALSIEHGGEYSDLCRVTAIIGITDGYYESFKDNFIDRVTHQIEVSENAYGNQTFLAHMAGRYLNAIFCTPQEISNWYQNGAKAEEIPHSSFAPDFSWETIELYGKEVSLYPFNSSALIKMYDKLVEKTPREFLLRVIRDQLKEYIDGKIYGDWNFPSKSAINGIVKMDNDAHSSLIDSLAELNDFDKARLKVLLQIWCNGSAEVTVQDNRKYIGGLPIEFLLDINLENFKGVERVKSSQSEENIGNKKAHTLVSTDPSIDIPVLSPEDKRRIELQQNKINNIEEWYQNNKPLGYSADLRKQLRTFVFNAINWQAEGIPAYLAKIKMDDNNFIYIHNQVQQTDKSKAFVKLERTAGNRDILLALCKYDYSKSWDFDNGVFFQLKLVNWLERNKNFIKKSVCGYENTEDEYPTFKWSVATEFLRRSLLGNAPIATDERELVRELFEAKYVSKNLFPERKNDDWLKVVRKVENDEDKFKMNYEYMQGYANTFMGIVGDGSGGNLRFYKGELVLRAIKKLKEQNWWLYNELPEETTTSILDLSASCLKDLYPRITTIIESEKQNIQNALIELSRLLGGEITFDLLLDTTNAIRHLFVTFSANNIIYKTETKIACDQLDSDRIRDISMLCSKLKESLDERDIIQLFVFYSSDPAEQIYELIKLFNEVKKIALNAQKDANENMNAISKHISKDLVQVAIEKMQDLYNKIANLEVSNNAG
jgi:hypothetical protein